MIRELMKFVPDLKTIAEIVMLFHAWPLREDHSYAYGK